MKIEKTAQIGELDYLLRFVNRTKPGTALTGESLYIIVMYYTLGTMLLVLHFRYCFLGTAF